MNIDYKVGEVELWVSGKFMWIRRVKVVPLSHE